jgi:hypothetical protein
MQQLAQSSVPPKDFTSNTPHILAVWYEFKRAAWPLTSIGLAIEYDEERREVANGQQSGVRADGASNGNGNGNAKMHGKGGKSRRRTRPNVKVDIVCKGGDEWIKVNTCVHLSGSPRRSTMGQATNGAGYQLSARFRGCSARRSACYQPLCCSRR